MGNAVAAPGRDSAPQGRSAATSVPQPRASPQLRVPREGLSLAALRSFADAHAGRVFTLQTDDGPVTLPFLQLTTVQVVQVVVKPATANGGGSGGGDCTYAELLLAQARERGGTAAAGPRQARCCRVCVHAPQR
jgi:hypothetical protein